MRRRTALAAVMAVLIPAFGLTVGAGVASAATTPPWEPDPNAASPYGAVLFYDSTGNLLTGGNDLTHLADYAAATTDGGTTDGGTGAKATLVFANPTPGTATGAWPTASASASTVYPNPSAPAPITGPGFSHPVVAIGATDANLANFISGHTVNTDAGYANVYQVRIIDNGPNGGSGSNYWETDVLVSGSSWSVLYPAPPTPGAPTLDSAVPGDGSVALSWTAGSSGSSAIDDYRVTVTPSGGAPTVTDLGSTTTSATISSLVNGTSYSFSVEAHNSSGWGSPSNVRGAVAGGKLTGLTFTPGDPATGTDHHAQLTLLTAWSAASDPPTATGIRVCLQPSTAAAATFASCTSGTVHDVAGSATGTTFTGLASGVGYRVTAWPDYNSMADFGAAASASIPGSTLTSPAAKTIVYGSSVTLSTKLTRTGTTTVIASAPLTLWRKPAGSSVWTQISVSGLKTNSSGVATHTFAPTVNTVFQWRYAGASTHMSAVGNQTVNVAFKVVEHATSLQVRHGSTLHLYGTVAPSAHNQYVYLQVNGHTTTIRAKIVFQKLPNGVTTWGYNLVYKPAKAGTFKIRIYKPRTSANAVGYGATLTLRVT